jgi:DNA-binding CsgD family transcriptional regulator
MRSGAQRRTLAKMIETPSQAITIDIKHADAIAALSDPIHGGVFELIRRRRLPVTLPMLANQSGLSRVQLLRAIDALEAIGLVRHVRARAPRTVPAYQATCQRIVVAFDSRDPAECAAILTFQSRATVDVQTALRRRPPERLDGEPNSGWHQAHLKCRLNAEQLKGLGQRLHAVAEYLMQLTQSPDPAEAPDTVMCNFAVGLTLVPLETPLLPSPPIFALPRSTLGKLKRFPGGDGLDVLTPRERQVAVALRDGRTRGEIAKQLGLSPNTVGTVMRRLHAKLGVHRRAELVSKLAGL